MRLLFYHILGTCVFVDAEHALDPALAKAIGVDTSNLLLSQPDCGEQALSLVDTLIRSGSVDVVVVDSVSNLSQFVVSVSSSIGDTKEFGFYHLIWVRLEHLNSWLSGSCSCPQG